MLRYCLLLLGLGQRQRRRKQKHQELELADAARNEVYETAVEL